MLSINVTEDELRRAETKDVEAVMAFALGRILVGL